MRDFKISQQIYSQLAFVCKKWDGTLKFLGRSLPKRGTNSTFFSNSPLWVLEFSSMGPRILLDGPSNPPRWVLESSSDSPLCLLGILKFRGGKEDPSRRQRGPIEKAKRTHREGKEENPRRQRGESEKAKRRIRGGKEVPKRNQRAANEESKELQLIVELMCRNCFIDWLYSSGTPDDRCNSLRICFVAPLTRNHMLAASGFALLL